MQYHQRDERSRRFEPEKQRNDEKYEQCPLGEVVQSKGKQIGKSQLAVEKRGGLELVANFAKQRFSLFESKNVR